MSSDFSPDQKRYLEGFVSGLSASRVARTNVPAKSEPVGPDAIHLKAQDRTVAAGGKLNDQEKIKRDEHPFVRAFFNRETLSQEQGASP